MTQLGMGYPGWICVKDWKVAIGVAPKCGTRSILHAMMDWLQPGISYESAKAAPSKWRRNDLGETYARFRCNEIHKVRSLNVPTVGIARDPVDRFASLWRCQVRDGLAGIAPRLLDKNPRRLFDLIQARPLANVHWIPQDLFLVNADTVVRLERLDEWWTEFFAGMSRMPALKHLNSTAGDTSIDEDLADAIREHYAADVKIYETAA